jgi:hypothetical protein
MANTGRAAQQSLLDFDAHRRRLEAAVDGLERLGPHQLTLTLRETKPSFADRRKRTNLFLNFAGSGLRTKIAARILSNAACDDIRSTSYVAALGTIRPELVRSEIPTLIDKVLLGKVQPDYAHLLPLLWAYRDYPQLTRLIKYMKAEASDYDRQTLVEFLEDHQPDDLLDHIQPWWTRREPQPYDPDVSEEPGPEARKAWADYSSAYDAWRTHATQLLELDWRTVASAAHHLLDEHARARLLFLPGARKHLRSELKCLSAEAVAKLLPAIYEHVGVDVTLTAQSDLQQALAAAGLGEAASHVSELERQRIGIYDEHHRFAAPRSAA